MAVHLQAALNGTRGRDEHPAVPLGASELAGDAAAVAAEGASSVHVHPRGHDERETLDAAICGKAVELIRRAAPTLTVGLSTAEWIEPDRATRLEAIRRWEVLPDFVSVNLVEDGAAEVASLCLGRGIAVEAGLATVGDVERLASSGIADDCLRALVEPASLNPVQAVRDAAAIAARLERLCGSLPQLHHGLEHATWPVLQAALRHGRDIRVGLEDTLWLPDGTRATGNAELVRSATSLFGQPRSERVR